MSPVCACMIAFLFHEIQNSDFISAIQVFHGENWSTWIAYNQIQFISTLFFTLVLSFNQKTFLKRDRGNHWHLFPVAIGLCLVFRNKCEKSCVAVEPKTRCEKCFSSIDLFTQIFCDIDVKKHTLVFSYVHVHHSLNTSKVAEHHMLMWSRSLNNSCLSKVIVSRLDGLSSS